MMNHKIKRKWAILSAIILVILLIFGGGYYVYRQIARSSQELQTKAADSGLVSNQSVYEQLIRSTTHLY